MMVYVGMTPKRRNQQKQCGHEGARVTHETSEQERFPAVRASVQEAGSLEPCKPV